MTEGDTHPASNDSDPKAAAARSEIQDYLDVREQRRWIFPRAALVGAGAGIPALLFRAALSTADTIRIEPRRREKD
jgi:uncharacterized protein involved in exopolysaccharide biosynthesis